LVSTLLWKTKHIYDYAPTDSQDNDLPITDAPGGNFINNPLAVHCPYDIILKMDFTKTTLGNGVRVIVIPTGGESVTSAIWFGVGSRAEDKRINGISHFLEHMAFKGSKKRLSARAISEEVDGFGGEFNAGTSKEWTNYYIKARAGKVENALDILSDMLINPLLDPKEIKREKGVIIQEIAMYEDTPMAKIGDYFENLIYKGTTLGWDIAGTKGTVRGMTRADFLDYRRRFYTSENMVVTLAGGVTEKQALELVERYFGGTPKVKTAKIDIVKPMFDAKIKTFRKKKKTDQTHLVVGFPGKPYGASTRYAESLLSTVLGGGMSSRLFLEVRERRGLAYAVKPVADHAVDVGYFGAYAGTKPEKSGEAQKVILDQFYGVASGDYPIAAQELIKAKEFVKGHLALSLEDTEDLCGFYAVEELYTGKLRTPAEVYEAIDKVTSEQVTSLAKELFVEGKAFTATISPK